VSPRVRENSVHPRLQSGACVRPLNFTVRQHVSSVPHSSWHLAVLAAVALTVVFATLYGLWQAFSGRTSVAADTSVAVTASVVSFYLVYLALSFLTQRIEPLWPALLASISCFALILSRRIRHQQLPHARVFGAVVFGLISLVVLGAFCGAVGIYVGCQFGRCVLP
jgi:hypothetical protein